MIVVTRLNGQQFAVNPDLLQRIESTPDTILTLIDGTKYVVAESLEEVTQRVVEYRARVVAATVELTGEITDTAVAAVTELRPVDGSGDRADRADRPGRADRTDRTDRAPERAALRPVPEAD